MTVAGDTESWRYIPKPCFQIVERLIWLIMYECSLCSRASLSFGHVYIKPVTDKLEEFRKASIAYVVMPLDDNTFQVAAASGNDVWIVQMSDCTICT